MRRVCAGVAIFDVLLGDPSEIAPGPEDVRRGVRREGSGARSAGDNMARGAALVGLALVVRLSYSTDIPSVRRSNEAYVERMNGEGNHAIFELNEFANL